MKKHRVQAADVLLFVLGAVLLLGTLFVFHPCAAMQDGSWMRCHWAGVCVSGLGAVVLVAAAVRPFVAGVRAGTDVVLLLVAVLAAVIPQGLIPLCMSKDMRCHSLMRPCVVLVSAAIAIVCAVDFVVQRKKGTART